MIKSAKDISFSEFISPEIDKERRFVIPVYQREYAWSKSQCEDFFNDICYDDAGHYFMGSIIWVEDTYEIIDGQQRLTTIGLLLMAIYSKLPDHLTEEEYIAKRYNMKHVIVNHQKKARIELQKQNRNHEDYEYLVNTLVIKENNQKLPAYFVNRKIARNFEFFKLCIQDYSVESLFELYEKILQLSFVSIEVDSHQSAFQLFEVMNNRGLSLSAFDIIKSKYISKSKEEGTDEWIELVNLLGDNHADQEQFLRNNYNAFRYEYNKLYDVDAGKENLKYAISPKATKSNMIKIYEELLNNETDFMEVLKQRAGLYSVMLGIQSDKEDIEAVFKKFRNAKATSAFTLLLYLYNYTLKYNISDEQLIELFEYILKFFIRRNLTNNPGTGKIPQLLMDIIEKINISSAKTYAEIYSIVTAELKAEASSDELLQEVLNGDMYINNTDMTRFLLCSLATSDENISKETKIDLWMIDEKTKRYVWTIEHIFPEGENIRSCWVDMIANGDKEKAKEYREKYVHKLGNLTLSGYNSQLSNMSFEAKKNRTITVSVGEKEKTINAGYNNGLSLNKDVYTKSEWNVDHIIERTKRMVEEIMNSLSLD